MSTPVYTNSTNKGALSPSEQIVYLELCRNHVMPFSKIAKGFKNNNSARMAMSRLVRKGYAVRPRQGIYAAIPPALVGRKNYEVDRYILADAIVRPGGALAYHTALELHGAAQSYFNTVFAFTSAPRRRFEDRDVEYVFIQPKSLFGIQRVIRMNVEVRVTDRERTFLDCLRRLDYCGGPEEYIKSVQTFHMLDFKNLEGHLRKFGERSLYQKAGYVLTLLADDFHPPGETMKALGKKVGKKAYYLLPRSAPGSGRLDGEWNVIVPKNVKELMRFV